MTQGESAKTRVVRISGDADIYNSRCIREELLAALDACDEVTVDLAEVSSCDVTILQILCSALLYASDEGKKLKITGGQNRHIAELAGLSALRPQKGLEEWPW